MGIFRVAIILGGNFPVGKCLSESYRGWEFSGWELSRWELSWVGIFLGGNFPRWEFSGWELSGGNHPGGNHPGIRNKANVSVFEYNFKEVQMNLLLRN